MWLQVHKNLDVNRVQTRRMYLSFPPSVLCKSRVWVRVSFGKIVWCKDRGKVLYYNTIGGGSIATNRNEFVSGGSSRQR